LRCGRLVPAGSAQAGWDKRGSASTAPSGEERAADAAENSYAVSEQHLERRRWCASKFREAPAVLPLRVLFVPHWKYTAPPKPFAFIAHRLHQRHVTHLASRSVFIDADRYVSEDSLDTGCARTRASSANSVQENDAEKAGSRIPKAPEGGAPKTLKPRQRNIRAPVRRQELVSFKSSSLACCFFCLGLGVALGARSPIALPRLTEPLPLVWP